MAEPAKKGGAGLAKIVGLNGLDVSYIARKYRIVLGRRSKSSAADVVIGAHPPPHLPPFPLLLPPLPRPPHLVVVSSACGWQRFFLPQGHPWLAGGAGARPRRGCRSADGEAGAVSGAPRGFDAGGRREQHEHLPEALGDLLQL